MYIAEDINLKPLYNGIISNFYNTTIDKADFGNSKETVGIINNYVSEKTSGLIPELFDEQAVVMICCKNSFFLICLKNNTEVILEFSHKTCHCQCHLLQR